MKMLLCLLIALVAVASFACTETKLVTVQATASPTPRSEAAQQVSPTATAPSPTPCPACPTAAACPACPTCPTCPAPIVCPQCPTCPTCAPCPDSTGGWSTICTNNKLMIEFDTVMLDIAEKVGLLDQTPDDIRAEIARNQQAFNQDCQGVALAEPSLMTYGCALVGIWLGRKQQQAQSDPSPQNQSWATAFDQIIDRYCKTNY